MIIFFFHFVFIFQFIHVSFPTLDFTVSTVVFFFLLSFAWDFKWLTTREAKKKGEKEEKKPFYLLTIHIMSVFRGIKWIRVWYISLSWALFFLLFFIFRFLVYHYVLSLPDYHVVVTEECSSWYYFFLSCFFFVLHDLLVLG